MISVSGFASNHGLRLPNSFFTWTANVQPSLLVLRRMKLKNLIPLRYRTKLIRQFGQAKLVKLPNGQHEVIGGTDQDRTTYASDQLRQHFD